MSRSISASMTILACAAAALAGAPTCPTFTVTLLDGYRAVGNAEFLVTQSPAALWQFRETSPVGPLLVGLPAATLGADQGYWGDPAQPYTVPTVGAIYSELPEQNQIHFYRRLPSFTGVMLHPGFDDSKDSVATFVAPTSLFLTQLSLHAEDLGNFNGALISAGVYINGASTTLIASTFLAPAPADAVTLNAPAGLPLLIHQGDIIWVQTNRNGDASEDWVNVNTSLTFQGPPVILAAPLTNIACPGSSWKATIDAPGAATFRWRKGAGDLTDGPTGTGSTITGATTPALIITGVSLQDIAQYTCRVTNSCGMATSASVIPTLRCPGDADPNNSIEFADITAVLANFGTVYAATVAGRGDADCSGAVDFADITRVLSLFGLPCP